MQRVHNKRILVTGADTFLGKRLIEVLSNTSSFRVHGMASITVASMGVNQYDRVIKEVAPDTVIHCDIDTGGISYILSQPAKIYTNNTVKSMQLHEALRLNGVKKCILVLSSSSYGESKKKLLKEEDWWRSAFGSSSQVIGFVAKQTWVNAYAYNQQYGIEYTSMIVGNVYGPHDYFDPVKSYAAGALVRKIMDAKRTNKSTVNVWGTGKPVRDWVYVDDVIECIVRAINRKTDIEPINIGTGNGASISKLAQTIATVAQYTGTISFDPTKPDGSAHRVLDTARCRAILGYTPTTMLSVGMEKTIAWYTTHV